MQIGEDSESCDVNSFKRRRTSVIHDNYTTEEEGNKIVSSLVDFYTQPFETK